MKALRHPRLLAALFFGLALLAMLLVTVNTPLNHDEDQFIASAALLSREGLLPYRDFAYFHTPNLVSLYALLFLGTDHLLLAARVFSTVCAWAMGLGVFALAWHRLTDRPTAQRLLLALGVAALLLTNPVFVYTFPKAWNNLLPALLVLLAFAAHCEGARRACAGWFFVGGLLVSLAAGTRISFAPLALPFLVMPAFVPGLRRFPALAVCAGGMFVGALPVLLMAAMAPSQFLFDNFIYNSRVNSLYRLASGDTRSALASKGEFLLKVLINPGNAILLAAFVVFAAIPGLRDGRWRRDYPLALLFAILPFASLGVFAPTPSYSQYYSVLAVLAAIGVALGISFGIRHAGTLLATAVGVGLIASLVTYRMVPRPLFVPEWVPMQVHAQGRAVTTLTGPGRILTLAPIIALEGGAKIYEPFVTGSFAWRTAPFVPATDRIRFGFVAEADLPVLLAANPPAGIVLGIDKKRETPLLAYAKARAYRRVELPGKISLWLPPAPANPAKTPPGLDASGPAQ